MRRGRLAATVLLLAAALGAAGGTAALAAAADPGAGGTIDQAAATSDGRVRLAVIVPITVPASADGLIPSVTLAAYTSPDGTLTRQLDAVDDRPVTLAVDPRIVASIRVLGAAAPPSATAWLERLEESAVDRFALAYADADPVAAIEADGTATALAPVGFEDAIDPAAFAPVDDAGSDLPPLPESPEDVTSLAVTADGLAWPSDGLIATDLPVLAAQGIAHVLVDSSAVDVTAPALTPTTGGPDLLVADEGIGAALRAAVDALPADAAATLGALQDTIAAAAAAPGSSLRVVTLDRLGQSPSNRLPIVLSSLETDAGVQLVGLGEALAEPTVPGALIDRPQSDERRSAVADLLAAERRDAAFATVADTPELLTAPARTRLLALLSAAWGDGAVWHAAVERSLERSAELTDAVTIVESSDPYVQISPQSQLSVPVRNNLDVPITVYLSARPLSITLTVDDAALPVAIPVQPDSTATGLIPVEAVASGRVQVELVIADRTGSAVGTPVLVQVDAQPAWETVGVFGGGAAVLAVFGIGLVRAIMRRRRQLDGTGDPQDVEA